MDIVNNLLFWLHLVALTMGGAVSFGMPVIGSKMPGATAETRPLLFRIAHNLSSIGRAAFATLVVTGPLLIWLKYGGASGFSGWFTLKMVLVVIMLVGVILSGILLKRAEKGDRNAGQMMPRVGAGLLVTYLAIILSAVFAFN